MADQEQIERLAGYSLHAVAGGRRVGLELRWDGCQRTVMLAHHQVADDHQRWCLALGGAVQGELGVAEAGRRDRHQPLRQRIALAVEGVRILVVAIPAARGVDGHAELASVAPRSALMAAAGEHDRLRAGQAVEVVYPYRVDPDTAVVATHGM